MAEGSEIRDAIKNITILGEDPRLACDRAAEMTILQDIHIVSETMLSFY